MLYAFTENFVLPLSHDEVVYGKGSLLGRMPGDDWQKFANLRALYGVMWAQPGKKLLFMGAEIAQWTEWHHETSLDWHLLQWDRHQGIARWLADLNHLYRRVPALHQLDCEPAGFEWVDCNDWEQSTLAFLRRGRDPADMVLVVLNFTPVPREQHRVGLPVGGVWRELLNSDATLYGGSGVGNAGQIVAEPTPWHGRPYSARLVLPPLGALFFQPEAAR
jgi:1,4-alpha-glucan branching enzyme